MEFFHVRMLIGIILGLSITHMLRAAAKFIQHPGRYRLYWPHLLWAIYVFLLLLHFWWWEFKLSTIPQWSFLQYFFVTCYIMSFYLLSAILFPEDLKDHQDDYQTYFFSMKKWFFGVMAATFLLDLVDTLMKGSDYFSHFGMEYPFRIGLHVLLCLLAIRINRPVFHYVLSAVFILYELSFILRLYSTVQ